MDQIIHAVQKISTTPGAEVDISYRRGREALIEAHNLRTRGLGDIPHASYNVDQAIMRMQNDLAELQTWVAPHRLPDDYIFFLEYCGGLHIKAPTYYFSIRGIGPMMNHWYFHIIGDVDYFDEGLYENGFLLISDLVLKDGTDQLIHFFLDLGGVLQKYSVLSVRDTWRPEAGVEDLRHFLQNLQENSNNWAKIADSFTDWLELMAKTQGTLGLINR